MRINYTYHQDFVNLLNTINGDYFRLEGISQNDLDINAFSEKFFGNHSCVSDVSIDANANVDAVSILSYNSEIMKPTLKMNSLYLLWHEMRELYDLQIANNAVRAHLEGDLYINDITGIQMSYCYNFSTFDLALFGMPFLSKLKVRPPKHLTSFFGQITHFITFASNSILGACGLADVLIVASHYAKHETDKTIKQELQGFIYSCGQPFRGGLQSAFTNISIYDDLFLDELLPGYEFPDGTTPDKQVVKKLQNMFLELMNETLNETVITFPVVTACFSIDEKKNIRDTEFLKLISEQNRKYGFINIYCGKSSTLSSCCRLRSDKQFFNMFGAGSLKIGSLGVCTLNLPRLGSNRLKKGLSELVTLALQINHAKRSILKRRIDQGMMPLYSHGFMGLNTQYSTIGFVGIYEMVENMGEDILTVDGERIALFTLEVINKIADDWSKQHGYAVNCEQVPAESSAIKLAQKDGREIYSNQFLPLQANVDMIQRIELQGKFDSLLSGGGIVHLNVENEIDDADKIVRLIRYTAKQGVVYFGINYNIQKCENDHVVAGKNEKCPVCLGKITDNFSRIVGYIVNTKHFAKTRRELDYPNRKFYGDV